MQVFHRDCRLTCNASQLHVNLWLVLSLSVARVAHSSLGLGSCLNGDSPRSLSDVVLLHIVLAESTGSLEDFAAVETVLLLLKFFHVGKPAIIKLLMFKLKLLTLH